ncbi:hypothetical protein BT67DRAFT_441037 [Trichocladium antarcticum]|uniref:Uncharacterized protein n=1 Tax=Trichocladium antarcticum TaxID=1450529 RepID=A0AAN6ZFB1_9PEZI|nr:hypothetical protein BT67DRAFT_441037 [Trichocladium antarcticum]
MVGFLGMVSESNVAACCVVVLVFGLESVRLGYQRRQTYRTVLRVPGFPGLCC